MPEVLGQPCWQLDGVKNAISTIAMLDKRSTHYFLSSHDPISNLVDEKKGGKSVSEVDFFNDIFDGSRQEVVAFIFGLCL